MVKQLRPSHFWRKLSPNWRQVEFSSFSDLKRFPKKLLFTNSLIRRQWWLRRSYYRCWCCKLTLRILLITYCCVFLNTGVVLQTTNRPQFAHRGVLCTRRCGCLCAKGDSISTYVYKYTRWRKKYQQARFFFHTCVVLKTTDRPQFARGGVLCTRHCGYLCAKGYSIYTFAYNFTRWRKKYQQARFFSSHKRRFDNHGQTSIFARWCIVHTSLWIFMRQRGSYLHLCV